MDLNVSRPNHQSWLLGLSTAVFFLTLGSSAKVNLLNQADPIVCSGTLKAAAVELRTVTYQPGQPFEPPHRGIPGRREGAGSR